MFSPWGFFNLYRCTIAEMFLDGTPLFSYQQLLKYKNSEYDPEFLLQKIENQNIKNIVSKMIILEPKKRLSAQKCLGEWLVFLI